MLGSFNELVMGGVTSQALLLMSMLKRPHVPEAKALMLNGVDENLSKLFGTPDNQKLWTASIRMKRTRVGVEEYVFATDSTHYMRFNADDTITIRDDSVGLNTTTTSREFRDIFGWYHFTLQMDAVGLAFKFYVHDVLEFTDTITNNNPTLGSAVTHYIGSHSTPGGWSSANYAEFVFIDNQKLEPTSFSETDEYGNWIVKNVSFLTGGANGTYLDFKDSANLGNDVYGGTDWTETGLTADNQLRDTPTNNFCTLHNFQYADNRTDAALIEGGLTVDHNAASWTNHQGTEPVRDAGKAYVEVYLTSISNGVRFGFCTVLGPQSAFNLADFFGTGDTSPLHNVYVDVVAGTILKDGVNQSTGLTFAATDVVGLEFDRAAATLDVYKNGTSIGSQVTGIDADVMIPFISVNNDEASVNFGGGDPTGYITSAVSDERGEGLFEHTPSAGFLALCTNNIPAPAVPDPSEGFQAEKYVGDGVAIGSGGNSIVLSGNSDLQGDAVCIKNRDTSDRYALFDTLRGTTKLSTPDGALAQTTDTESLDSFDANGFTVGSNVTVNTDTENFVSWVWKEGAKYGFDMVHFDGTGATQTVNHDLGGVPDCMIDKEDDEADAWYVWHKNLAALTTWMIDLARGQSEATDAAHFPTAPTATQFTVGGIQNVSGTANVMNYLWRSIPGFSLFGHYRGTGFGPDGPMIYCGFRPELVIIRNRVGPADWVAFDGARSNYKNPQNLYMRLDIAGTELNAMGAGLETDLLDLYSNGFRPRQTNNTQLNGGANDYIFMAWARCPRGGIGVSPAVAV